MIILLLFGIALTAVAAAFAVRAVAIGGIRRRNTLAQISSYGFTGTIVASDQAPKREGLRALLDSFATKLGTLVARRFVSLNDQEIRKQLRTAGLYHVRVET